METYYSEYKHCLIWNGLPNEEPELPKRYAKILLRLSDAWMIRNCYDWDCNENTNFWFIIKEDYLPEFYSKKTRKYIKKANDRFNFEIIDKELLLIYGYEIYQKAFLNYKVNDQFQLTQEQFVNGIYELDSNHDIWGAIDKETGRLEAFSICRKLGNIVEFETSKANPDFLSKYYILYGLYDARNSFYLEKEKKSFVISSARSITEHSNIQNFMIEKFGFRRAYCRFELFHVF